MLACGYNYDNPQLVLEDTLLENAGEDDILMGSCELVYLDMKVCTNSIMNMFSWGLDDGSCERGECATTSNSEVPL